MSSINIFELESVQDLNEKEVSNVVGGWFKPIVIVKKIKPIKVDVDVRRDTFANIQQMNQNTAVAQGGNSVGDNNDNDNHAL